MSQALCLVKAEYDLAAENANNADNSSTHFGLINIEGEEGFLSVVL